MSEPSPSAGRLTVELNTRSSADLTTACYAEKLNKTTIVNRAIQVYERIRANQAEGGHVVIVQADGTAERIRFT